METLLDYLLYTFIVIAFINTLYYLFFFKFAFAPTSPTRVRDRKGVFAKAQVAQVKSTVASNKVPPLSLIVCAKNEAKNLKEHIPSWLAQDYPDFQLLLINDASRDDTLFVMESFQAQDKRIKIVNVQGNETFWGSKKYALTLGIKAASHEHLVFTDADCRPASKHWLALMAGALIEKQGIVLGYGAYEKQKRSLLNMLIRFETVLTAVQYLNYALWGNPYMGVGRNLAYSKALFFDAKGFISHMDLYSGDDDLFVNEAANASNVTVQTSPESFTISHPKYRFSDWFLQKRRHVSTATRYKKKHQFLLALFFATQFLFLIGAVAFGIIAYRWEWFISAIGVRYAVAWISFGSTAYRLQEKDIIWAFPVLELFLVFFQITIFNTNLFSKPNRWK